VLLEVESIAAAYGDAQALFDVSMEVEAREIVAILGANGAGKTTLLRVISGIVRARNGAVRWNGADITRLSPAQIVALGIVHVPEGRHVFPKMTVLDNLRAGAYTAAAWRRRDELLEEAFALFPRLAERRGQLAGTLSGGEQQMLAIGRGLMAQPKLLLLDEPSLGLAPIIVDVIFDKIRKINVLGCAILIVEQNVRRALEIALRAYVIEHGRLTMHGASRELASNADVRRAYLGV
jgi:branched-chain amino acid transport system ATP-binding protein